MKTTYRSIYIGLILLCIGVCPLTAQTDYLDYRGELRSWPLSPRPELKVQAQSISDGENTYDSFVLSGAGLTLVMPREDDILVRPENPRYSVSFTHRVVPQMVIGISVFPSGSFLDALSSNDIMGYLKGLMIRHPKEVKITVIQGPLSENPKAGFPFLGDFPAYVVYDTTDEATGLVFRRAEYFAEVNGKLIVATYENQVSTFDQMKGFVEPMLARIYVR